MEQCYRYTGWLETVADLIIAYLYSSVTLRKCTGWLETVADLIIAYLHSSVTLRQVHWVTRNSGGFDNLKQRHKMYFIFALHNTVFCVWARFSMNDCVVGKFIKMSQQKFGEWNIVSTYCDHVKEIVFFLYFCFFVNLTTLRNSVEFLSFGWRI